MRTLSILLSLIAVFVSVSVHADEAEDARYEAVKALGRLNGTALACRYDHAVSRMKNAMVTTAPKVRAYGQAFDEASNEGFMAFVKAGEPCPNELRFVQRVETVINEMEAKFAE